MSLNKLMVLRGNHPMPKTTTIEMSIRLVLWFLARSCSALAADLKKHEASHAKGSNKLRWFTPEENYASSGPILRVKYLVVCLELGQSECTSGRDLLTLEKISVLLLEKCLAGSTER